MEFSRRNQPIIVHNNNLYYDIPIENSENLGNNFQESFNLNNLENLEPVMRNIDGICSCKLLSYDIFVIVNTMLYILNIENMDTITKTFDFPIFDVVDDETVVYILLENGQNYIFDFEQCYLYNGHNNLIFDEHNIWEIHDDYVLKISDGQKFDIPQAIDVIQRNGYTFISSENWIRIFTDREINQITFHDNDSLAPVIGDLLISKTGEREITLYNYTTQREINKLIHFNYPVIKSFYSNKFIIQDINMIYIITC